MYLSRLILNPRSRRVQKEIADPYQMHRSVMRAFPEDLTADSERVLFRSETPTGGPPVLLVQSLTVPDWGWLATDDGARGYLVETEEPNPWVKEFSLDLHAGQLLAFRLRANPTVKRNGKRLGLYREEEQLGWAARKAERGGFRLLSARTSSEEVLDCVVHRPSRDENLQLLCVQFDGLLEVRDPVRLRRAVEMGIGSGKGFGFGLLSLARPV
jgi:CRISPR system Cascade subunit CasE